MSNDQKRAIKPEKVGGFLDYLPSVMIARQRMLAIIQEVYERFGFVPLDTPAIERLDVLTGNKESFNMNLYRAVVVSGLRKVSEAAKSQDSDLALRFDLTVPLSRVVAAYPDKILKPFKRYQVGKVWRGEKPQAGRFREFVQFDADIIGSRSIMADTEIIQLMFEVMKALGFSNFLIKINNRKIFEALNQVVGLTDSDKKDELIRIIDSIGKIGAESVRERLGRKPDNEYDSSPNLSLEKIDVVMRFIQITGSYNDILDEVEKIVGITEIGKEGISELGDIVANLKALSVPEKNWAIDLSIARGLSYYTGPIFETVLTDLPEIGSVYSGGRFDGLVDRFVPGSNIPGTGASVGVDRLFAAMEELGKIKRTPSLTKVLVVMLDPELRFDYLKMVQAIRNSNIPTELYLDKVSLRTQITYAVKQEIPVVVIMGSDEKKENKIAIKDMVAKTQTTIDKDDLISSIKTILSSNS